MTDEKLTEGERSYLVHMALVLENHHVPEAAKALRCLDAALARVAELRALADERGSSVTKLVDRVQDIAQERDRAVSDAAEVRAEAAALRAEVERLRARVAELESIKPLLDAEQLSARLTEAERLYIENHHIPEVAKALRCLDAALARADAAERVMRQDCEHHIQRAHSAESEAEALRAENERLRAENSGLAEFAADYAEETDAFEFRLAAAEAEAAALRAKVERLKAVMMIQDEPDGCARCEAVMDGHEAATSDICHDCWNTLESRLAAAEALLRQARPLIQPLNGVLERCGNAIDAFLSTLKRATNDRCEFHRNGGCGPCNYCEDSRDE